MLLDDFSDFLSHNGITDIYKSKMPDEPSDAVCIYEYGGSGPIFAHSGMVAEQPSIQIVVRSESYQTARVKIQMIFSLIAQLTNTSLGQSMILRAIPVQSPFSLGDDVQGRIRLVSNFNIALAA